MQVSKLELFTQEAFYFQLPNFSFWKEQIKQIVLVEDNQNIHGHTTIPKEECQVKAKRTAWNSHKRYPILKELCDEIRKHLTVFIQNNDYDIPIIEERECWINWYGKNNYAQPHHHSGNLATVLFVDVENTDAKFIFNSNNNFVLIKKNVVKTNFTNLKELEVKDGTVLFFDGSFYHSVSPNTTDRTRITVAANFDVVYQKERNEY